jgi:8-oxo-dGTP pyrophosphatase MutT (NUDIX family)
MTPNQAPDATFEKVTVFVVRLSQVGPELLTFVHPSGGRQLPAGSVEPGEPFADAALREVREETGVTGLSGLDCIGEEIETLGDEAVALVDTNVHDPSRDSVPIIKRGHRVRIEGIEGNTYTVTQLLYDLTVDPALEIPGIRGTAIGASFARRLSRTFWFAQAENDGHTGWSQTADDHQFHVDWVPLCSAPDLIPQQARWLAAYRDAIDVRLSRRGTQ